MGCIHLESKTERTLYKERMFAFVHLAQEKDWRPDGDIIMIYTSPTLEQQE